MSLPTRITLLVVILLAACGMLAGLGIQRALRHSAAAELNTQLAARLAWLEGAIEVELDDGEVQLEQREEPAGAAPFWSVRTGDGILLWRSSGTAPAGAPSKSQALRFGSGDAPLAGALLTADSGVDGARQLWTRTAVDQIPQRALAAGHAAIPQLNIDTAWRRTRLKKKDPANAVFELRGTSPKGHHEVRVDAAGAVLRLKHDPAGQFVDYQMPADAPRLDLVLETWASSAAMDAEASRGARVMWSGGAVALALTAVALALLIRWQLRPLKQMARQAATIGPGDPSARIRPAGGSLELHTLRTSINSMVDRLAEALGRERRFASAAAHELRTPLAQLRMSIDVALRQPRDAAAYRDALQEASLDVDRLQRLVLGLLQLARSAEPIPVRPVALTDVLSDLLTREGLPAAPADGLWVQGDAELLRSAIANVLENARRYAPSQPPTLRVESDSREVRVMIADHGPGIPEAQRQRIFEPMARLDASAAQHPDGLGLGLALARASVRAMGGELVCRERSDARSGAEFVFTLLRANPTPASEG